MSNLGRLGRSSLFQTLIHWMGLIHGVVALCQGAPTLIDSGAAKVNRGVSTSRWERSSSSAMAPHTPALLRCLFYAPIGATVDVIIDPSWSFS